MSSCCRSEEEDHGMNMNLTSSSDSSVIEKTTSMLSIDDESEKMIHNTEPQCCSKVKQAKAKKCSSSPVTVSVAVVTP